MKSIFLIDDDADDREIFSDSLMSMHPSISFHEAQNGLEAFAILRSGIFVPDLIFLDLNMPIMDGKTFLVRIKEDESLKDIPIVIYTTSSNQIDKDFAEKHSAALFLTKQYSIALLKEDLKNTLEKFLNI